MSWVTTHSNNGRRLIVVAEKRRMVGEYEGSALLQVLAGTVKQKIPYPYQLLAKMVLVRRERLGSTIFLLVYEEIGVEHNEENIAISQAVPRLLTLWVQQMFVSGKPRKILIVLGKSMIDVTAAGWTLEIHIVVSDGWDIRDSPRERLDHRTDIALVVPSLVGKNIARIED